MPFLWTLLEPACSTCFRLSLAYSHSGMQEQENSTLLLINPVPVNKNAPGILFCCTKPSRYRHNFHQSHRWQRLPWTEFHAHCTRGGGRRCRWSAWMCAGGEAQICTGLWSSFWATDLCWQAGGAGPEIHPHCCWEEAWHMWPRRVNKWEKKQQCPVCRLCVNRVSELKNYLVSAGWAAPNGPKHTPNVDCVIVRFDFVHFQKEDY